MDKLHGSTFVNEDKVEIKLKNIVKNLRNRTEKVKSFIEQPPTPIDESEDELENDLKVSIK